MPKTVPCTLKNELTGEMISFDSTNAADVFLKRGQGYVRRYLSRQWQITNSDGIPFTATLAEKTTLKKCSFNSKDYVMQLCWECGKAVGGCPWSKRFEPVPGWTAVATKVKQQTTMLDTYCIIACPLFAEG